MNWWTKIRLEVLRGESSKREVLRREGIHGETLKKILGNPSPPGYQINQPRPRPKVGPFLEQIAQILGRLSTGADSNNVDKAWIFGGGLDRTSKMPRCLRMSRMTDGSSMLLIIRIVPLHLGQIKVPDCL